MRMPTDFKIFYTLNHLLKLHTSTSLFRINIDNYENKFNHDPRSRETSYFTYSRRYDIYSNENFICNISNILLKVLYHSHSDIQ